MDGDAAPVLEPHENLVRSPFQRNAVGDFPVVHHTAGERLQGAGQVMKDQLTVGKVKDLGFVQVRGVEIEIGGRRSTILHGHQAAETKPQPYRPLHEAEVESLAGSRLPVE